MNQKLKNEELVRKSAEEFRKSDKNRIVVVLDNVRSLHNVGSVFRTCDAFLLQELWLCGVTGTPPNNEIEKTALGASDTVSWRYFKNTLEAVKELKAINYNVYAVEQAEKSISLAGYSGKTTDIGLIFGNEVYGVAQEVIDVCDGVIEIPQWGSKHSLNIAVSVGIILWELMREKGQ